MRHTIKTLLLSLLVLAQAFATSGDAHQFHAGLDQHLTTAALATSLKNGIDSSQSVLGDTPCEYAIADDNHKDCQHCCHCHSSIHAFMIPIGEHLEAVLASLPAYSLLDNHLLPRNSTTPYRPPIA